jgi:hypothetical protein
MGQKAVIGNGGAEMKSNVLVFSFIGIALIIVAGPMVMAHHSFAVAYDLSKPVTITGTITRVDWANPHISFYVDVKNKMGTVTSWGVDAASPAALAGRGVDRSSLRPGDTIIVEAFPARNGKPFAAASAFSLPDGRRILAGSDGAVSR